MIQEDQLNWQRFRSGDKKALERIYNDYRDKMYSYCLYVTGDREMSHDLVQESFAKLLESPNLPEKVESVKNYLFICLRNQLFKHLEKTKVRREYLATAILDSQPTAAAEVSCETRRFLQDILGKLKPDERDLILLRSHQQLSPAEISKITGLSNEAVRVRLFRIRKKMRQLAGEL